MLKFTNNAKIFQNMLVAETGISDFLISLNCSCNYENCVTNSLLTNLIIILKKQKLGLAVLLKKAKKDYYESLDLYNVTDTKKFWKTTKIVLM